MRAALMTGAAWRAAAAAAAATTSSTSTLQPLQSTHGTLTPTCSDAAAAAAAHAPMAFALWRAANAAPPPDREGPAEPWAVCAAVVGFDPDRGPVVEAVYPRDALSPAETDLVAAHAMPDSAAGGAGREDAAFCFRIPRRPSPLFDSSSSSSSSGANELLLAHTLFRQAPDPTAPRGGFQKALVLVTSTPYVGLPHALLRALASLAFRDGLSALQHAVETLAAWPDPRVQRDTRALHLDFGTASIDLSLPAPFLSTFAAPHGAVRDAQSNTLHQGEENSAASASRLRDDLEDQDNNSDNGIQDDSDAGRRTGSDLRTSLTGIVTSPGTSIGSENSSPTTSSRPSPSAIFNVADGDDDCSDLPGPDLDRHRDVAGIHEPDRHRNSRHHPRLSVPGGDDLSAPCGGCAALTRAMPLCMPASSPSAAPFHEVDAVRALSGAHDRLWALWELATLGEPILVFAPTPSQCAAAVLAIIGLLHPLPFMGDWRPYLTIQDPDYPRFVAASSSPARLREILPHGAVFGVTSPLMLSSLRFPHVLTVSGPGNRGLNVTHKPGLKSAHSLHVHRSKHLGAVMQASVTALQKADENGMCAAAYEVRAMLLDRVTRPFLRAFDRYLVPTWGDDFLPLSAEPYASDPFGRPVQLARFDIDTFPTNEDLNVPGVLALFTGSKTRARALYTQFVRGPVFEAWWTASRFEAQRECAKRHRRDLLEACVRGAGLRDPSADPQRLKDDFDQRNDIIDFALRIRLEMVSVPKGDVILAEKLSTALQGLAENLSDDLRHTICPSTSSLHIGA